MMYDLIIIGGGPAGVAAAVYAGRKKLKTLMVADSIGGQSFVSSSIENWIGTLSVTGFEFGKMLEAHVRAQEDVELKMPERVTKISRAKQNFEVTTDQGKYLTKAVLVATGGRRRKLGIHEEEKFEGKGVVYCSTCDAPLFREKDVVVIGGGNSALEAVEDLISYAKKIYLLVRSDQIKGDPLTFESIKKSDKVEIIFHAQPQEIVGEMFVSGLKYLDTGDNSQKQLNIQGVFVEIGSIPNSELVKDLVELNAAQEVVIDHKTGETSVPGVFAAGDVTDERFKQNNISAGDAVKATLAAYQYILGLEKK